MSSGGVSGSGSGNQQFEKQDYNNNLNKPSSGSGSGVEGADGGAANFTPVDQEQDTGSGGGQQGDSGQSGAALATAQGSEVSTTEAYQQIREQFVEAFGGSFEEPNSAAGLSGDVVTIAGPAALGQSDGVTYVAAGNENTVANSSLTNPFGFTMGGTFASCILLESVITSQNASATINTCMEDQLNEEEANLNVINSISQTVATAEANALNVEGDKDCAQATINWVMIGVQSALLVVTIVLAIVTAGASEAILEAAEEATEATEEAAEGADAASEASDIASQSERVADSTSQDIQQAAKVIKKVVDAVNTVTQVAVKTYQASMETQESQAQEESASAQEIGGLASSVYKTLSNGISSASKTMENNASSLANMVSSAVNTLSKNANVASEWHLSA